MEYAVVVLLSLLASGAATGENKVIRVENIQGVCDAIDGVSQHIETSASGSDCVYLRNGPDACKNCLDLNCTIPITASFFTITVKSEVSVLPCHDGNLNVPRHAINTSIFGSNGQVLFSRQSDQSYNDTFFVSVSFFSVQVDVSVAIDNQGNGVSTQASATAAAYGSHIEVFPLTFIPISCTEVDKSVCFGSIDSSSESSTPTPTTTSAGTSPPTSVVATTSVMAPTSAITDTPPTTSAGTPTPTSQHAGTAGNAGTPPPATAVWTIMLLAVLSLASLYY